MAAFNSVEKSFLAHLTCEKWWEDADLYLWEGFWYLPDHIKAIIAARQHFESLSDDVILASSMKTGTTWLKALIPCIMNRHLSDEDDPLITNHPNALMPSLEIQTYKETPNPDLSGIPSPRLFRTHMPYSALPESIKKSDCRIVYMSRNPSDTFVSLWHFKNSWRTPEQGPFAMDKAFEEFCRGLHLFGSFFDHVLEYWKESIKRPEKILFLKYEEMKSDPSGQVKKLAQFIGKPFSNDEEVDKVLWMCSLGRLKNLEVNKQGVDPFIGIPKRSYFRLGIVGDWKNYFTTEMSERLNQIASTKFEGSGLAFQM